MIPQLTRRMRRNRKSPAIRDLVRETRLHPHDLVAPLFVRDGTCDAEPVESMPGVLRHNLSQLIEVCRKLAGDGIRATAVFPCLHPSLKDETGSHFRDPNNLLLRAIARLKKEIPNMAVISDIALDPYTSHGHDGLLDDAGSGVDNDRTVEALCEMARLQAAAGADVVAPSDMMDGRVLAIRQTLDAAGFSDTSILAYSAKFNSAFYGPFRDAVGSKRAAGDRCLDKSGYQLDPANAREAMLETLLDEEEGADLLMVKPAGPYLDILRQLRDRTLLPVAAYQVSGEFAQIHAAARLGWLEYERARDESLLAIKRAGADLILTYFAGEIAPGLA